MPNSWIDADEYLTHGGVTIYHIYKGDEAGQGVRTYWYGLTPAASDDSGHMQDGAFDVRELPNPARHDPDTDEGRKAIICDAIDAGVLGVWPEHNNGLGDWCPWSGEPRLNDDTRCPAGCRASEQED